LTPVPAYRFRALDSSGKPVEGVLEGPDEASIVRRVQQMGNLPLSVNPADRAGGLLAFLTADLKRERGLPKQDVAYLTRELATLLGAGQDIDHALRFVVDTATTERIRKVVTELRDKVRGGRALAVALADHPQSFSRLYIGLVRAGEATGTLGDALSHLADLLERQRKLSATIRSALVYPALLSIATVLSVIFLLTFVLPQFTPIFEEAGAALPTPTRVVIAAGDFFRNDGLWLLAGLLVTFLGLRQLYRQPAQRRFVDHVLLRLPALGTFVKQSEAARFTRTLGTLLDNGVGLLPALNITREVMTNVAVADAVEHAALRVKEGVDLARPLTELRVFPAQTLHLLRLGGETGRLAEMCLRVADILEDQIRVTVQTLVSLIMPVITIVMGLTVAGIIASLLLAMLSLNDLAV
jgi:general secretion pathway protein F